MTHHADQLQPEVGRNAAPGRSVPGWLLLLVVIFLIYLFLIGIKLMEASVEQFEGFGEWLVRMTENRFVGLFIGILVTAALRSSSLTTSIAVGLVAGDKLSLQAAVPIIMGANIGTSVTNALVSLIHVRRRDEFERAFAGAIVHDLFNWCTVLVFFPLELATGYLGRVADWLTHRFVGVGSVSAFKPLDALIKPVVRGALWLLNDALGFSRLATAVVLTIVSVVLLLAVLAGITGVLRGYVVGKLEGVFDRFLFRNALVAFTLGMVVTAIVQSSSVTTSLVVPLMGAGLLTLEQVYPYTLGANVGTTITAFLASLACMTATSGATGFTIAMVHLLFNVHGSIVFYPLRRIPIGAARWYARLAARRARYALAFIVGVFFVVPVVVILVSRLW